MIAIPVGFEDLLERPIVVTLVTLMPDNQPQATPVWFNYKDQHIWINSARDRQKDRNMQSRPQVTILMIDPDNPYRYLEIRGKVVEITEENALEHIVDLCERYLGHRDFYGKHPERRYIETRVIYKIRPDRILAH